MSEIEQPESPHHSIDRPGDPRDPDHALSCQLSPTSEPRSSRGTRVPFDVIGVIIPRPPCSRCRKQSRPGRITIKGSVPACLPRLALGTRNRSARSSHELRSAKVDLTHVCVMRITSKGQVTIPRDIRRRPGRRGGPGVRRCDLVVRRRGHRRGSGVRRGQLCAAPGGHALRRQASPGARRSG